MTFLQTPEDFAAFEITKGCLHATVTKKIGYEASIAELEYGLSLVDEIAVRLNINGYADTILNFTEEYLEVMRDCAQEGGFEKEIVQNQMEEAL